MKQTYICTGLLFICAFSFIRILEVESNKATCAIYNLQKNVEVLSKEVSYLRSKLPLVDSKEVFIVDTQESSYID